MLFYSRLTPNTRVRRLPPARQASPRLAERRVTAGRDDALDKQAGTDCGLPNFANVHDF
jgi:hypothetical protein